PYNPGEDAVPPGIPGTGGTGRVVSSPLPSVSRYVVVTGGPSGAPGAAQPGGRPPTPSAVVALKTVNGSSCTADCFNFQVTSTSELPAGHDAKPVQPAQPKGTDGSFVALSDP